MFPKSYDMKKEKISKLERNARKKKISEHSLKNHLDSIKKLHYKSRRICL